MNKTTDSKLTTKLKAIEVIVKELQKLDESDRNSVISFALEQIGIKGISSIPTNQNGQHQEQQNFTGSDSEKLNMSMADFVKSKKPQNEYQRVAVIAYYLEKREGKKQFKNVEMSKANTDDARQPKIANITDAVTKARDRYKFLTRAAGNATHQLSTFGVDIVEALPDAEKVKALLSENRARKSSKKKVTKK